MYEGMFTDKQRMQLAREEFNDMNYMVNRDVTIGEGTSKTYVGTVDSFVRGRTGVNGDRDSGLMHLLSKMKGQDRPHIVPGVKGQQRLG